MASKMVIQQPKPLVVAAASDQWSSSICECDNVNECEFKCLYISVCACDFFDFEAMTDILVNRIVLMYLTLFQKLFGCYNPCLGKI